MSYHDTMGKAISRGEPQYQDGRTKQAFKDQTDINKLLARAARGESLSHLAKHGAVYGDFSDVDDLLTAHRRLERGQAIFNELPAEIRREFNNDLGKFFNFVNDPANRSRLTDVLPGLAAPGNQLPNIANTGPRGTPPGEPAAAVATPPAAPGAAPQAAPAAAPPPSSSGGA